jgi:hypothetical protein
VFGVFSFAMAQHNFSLQATTDGSTEKTAFAQNDDLYLNIVLDNVGGVAGCAFTLNYPTDVLTAPATTAEGTPVTAGEIISTFPFTYNTTDTHRANSSEPGKIYLSGAAIDTDGIGPDGGAKYDSGGAVLFTVKFTVGSSAPLGQFNLSLTQTEILNPDAGWGIDSDQNGTKDQPEPVPVLIGAVDNQDPDWNDLTNAFPDLLPSPPDPLAQLTLTATEEEDIPDSIDDAWEMFHFGTVNVANDLTDQDDDGYLDRFEQPTQFGGNDTDPNVQDEPFGANYDPTTDDRGPYQRVYTTPTSPKAEAGATFNIDVSYTTSDSNENLSGIGLLIHYDSTKLVWNEFTAVFDTSKIAEDAAPVDDTQDLDNDPSTDKYLQVAWMDVADNWPGIVPLQLYTVSFTVDAGLQDGDTSVIRFSYSDTAVGYTFYGAPVAFEVSSFNCDIDGNGQAKALSDGLLIARYLFGFRGTTLISNAVEGDCTRCTATEIEAFIANGIPDRLDIDGNGQAKALSDGLLIARYLFGFRGTTLISNAVEGDCTRCTATEIEAYLQSLLP